jgi:D-glycero-D-manno-heptose 1,7-bisphosphate phosphatase
LSRRAVFLDRDGTVNVEKDFVRHPDEVELLPGAREAIRSLRGAGYRIVVVTNQSGVARGYLDEPMLARIHARLDDLLDRQVDAWFHCPHHPDEGQDLRYVRGCTCRKPAAGLVRDAAAHLDLDLTRSWMIGDSARDVLVGRDLPLRTILVRSGKPIAAQRAALETAGFRPDLEVADLAAAAAAILATSPSA